MPIQRALDSIMTLGKGRVLMCVSFLGNGTSAPATIEGCKGATVSRSSEGVYVVTLPGKGAIDVVGAWVTTISDTTHVTRITANSEANRTFTITHTELDQTTAEDLESTDRCCLFVVLKNSSVKNG